MTVPSASDPAPRPLLPSAQSDSTTVQVATDTKVRSPDTLVHAFHPHHDRFFNTCIVATIIMVVWPWAFFGALWSLGGIQLQGRAGRAIRNNPKNTTYAVTVIGTLITSVVNLLFAKAITSLAQKWVTHKETDVFRISWFSALKRYDFLFPKEGRFDFSRRYRVRLVLVLPLLVATSNLVNGGVTAFLTPSTFTRTAFLHGTEVDLASSDAGCLAWFNSMSLMQECNWISHRGLNITSCVGDGQMVDVLESGGVKMASSFLKENRSLTLNALSTKNELRFVGPARGVLPIGPNGIPAFDTLAPSAFSKETAGWDLPYNYSLNLQGLTANVTCAYDIVSPIHFFLVSPGILQYNSSCPAGQEILINTTFISIISDSRLGFWACKASQPNSVDDSYTIYLRGSGLYSAPIGNITCLLSPVRPAVFPLAYTSETGVFTIDGPMSTSAESSTELVTRSLTGLASVMWSAQSKDSNLFAETVHNFGIQSLGQMPRAFSPTYLRLYEAMIKGVLEYEATYIRLVYSTQDNIPSSCLRSINGSANYEVFGWSATMNTIGYLLPMTLINLASLSILVYAMLISDNGKKKLPLFDPTEPVDIISAYYRHATEDRATRAWDIQVEYGRGEDGSYGFRPRAAPFRDVPEKESVEEEH